MQKPIKLLMSLLPFILFSCYDFVGGSNMSKRMLSIALPAPSDVAKLHIGVFDGAITTETMIYNQTVAAGSSIPFDLPVGINRIILVWAEGFDGIANYFGSLGPINIDINEDGGMLLPIVMKRFSRETPYQSFNLQNKEMFLSGIIFPGLYLMNFKLMIWVLHPSDF